MFVGGWRGGGGVQIRLSFFSLLYGMPAPSAEGQHPEAWPAGIYGHLSLIYESWPIIGNSAGRRVKILSI